MANAPFDRRPVDDPGRARDRLRRRSTHCSPAAAGHRRRPSSRRARSRLARDGRVAVWRTLGDARGPSLAYVIFSATKPVVAGGIWILIGEGLLDVIAPSRRVHSRVRNQRQRRHHGRAGVVAHVGLPAAPFIPVEWDDRERRLERFAQWRCNWEPGTRFEYHPTSAHWVLAELIERVQRRGFPRVLARAHARSARARRACRSVFRATNKAISTISFAPASRCTRDELQATLGIDALPVTEVTPEALMSFNRPEVRAVGVPGGGGVSTAADLALFYQGAAPQPGGIWKPDVLADVTGTVRNTFTDWLGTPANRTRGLVVAGDDGKIERAAAWAARSRRGRSVTTARAARSRGPTRRRGSRSVI